MSSDYHKLYLTPPIPFVGENIDLLILLRERRQKAMMSVGLSKKPKTPKEPKAKKPTVSRSRKTKPIPQALEVLLATLPKDKQNELLAAYGYPLR